MAGRFGPVKKGQSLILVDTSAWIDFFNHADSKHARCLKELIDLDEELSLVDIHLTEILQGISSEKAFGELRRYLSLFPILRPRSIETYVNAASISRICRKNGHPVNKTVDTIIAAVAIESGSTLLHKDKDFDVIARYTPLKSYYKHT